MCVNNMQNLIVYPTHVTNTSETLIDHIFTSNTTKHITAGIIYGDIADHLPTFCIFNNVHTYFKSNSTINYYDTKNYNKTAFLEDLKQAPFSEILKQKNGDSAFNKFLDIFIPISQKHIPIKTKKIKPQKCQARKPWITKELRKEIKRQHLLYEKSQKDKKNNDLSKEHKTFRNQLRKKLQRAKKNYHHELFLKHIDNAKKTWGIIKNILNNKREACTPKQIVIKSTQENNKQEEVIKNKKEIANHFNAYFTTVAAKLVEKISSKPKPTKLLKDYIKKNESCCLRFTKVSAKDVMKKLNQLNTKKAIGLDETHSNTD
eukprot:Lithocolla_globosa_v1_NODE_1521_length_2514_cov_56.965041.p1 type:complete len:317 gc:universal NODE_1521_length_2514_cov_56.965041:1174-2124(+)